MPINKRFPNSLMVKCELMINAELSDEQQLTQLTSSARLHLSTNRGSSSFDSRFGSFNIFLIVLKEFIPMRRYLEAEKHSMPETKILE